MCLPERPQLQAMKSAEDAEADAKYGRSDQVSINDCWGWVLMEATARACLLSITSEGWTGSEAFYIVAPTTTISLNKGEAATTSLELAQHFHSKVPVKAGWFEGGENNSRGFFDTTKAERLLGWKHDA